MCPKGLPKPARIPVPLALPKQNKETWELIDEHEGPGTRNGFPFLRRGFSTPAVEGPPSPDQAKPTMEVTLTATFRTGQETDKAVLPHPSRHRVRAALACADRRQARGRHVFATDGPVCSVVPMLQRTDGCAYTIRKE